MKNPTALRHVTQSGNLDTSDSVRMGMDADGMVILMSMLSNLYSNGNEAVVREYSCNARDSHVEAGVKRPIEVTLPTSLDPQFKVQDFGLGLSYEDIMSTYAMYGASTKRDSNDQIGAFGIGAKSAFTVGTMFTVTGVKNSEKTIAMFALNKEGVPHVTVLHRGLTDDPNGVLVDVGVENVDAIRRAADKLFPCWKPGTVLVDGQQPASIWDHTEALADSVYVDWNTAVSRYDGDAHFKLVMGGVPYAIPRNLWTELKPEVQAFYESTRNTSITYVLDVPIGSVDITPSREELRVTPRTRSTVGRMVELTINSMQNWITKRLDAAKTKWEAAIVYNELVAKLNYKADPTQVYWNGQALGPETVILDRATYVLERLGRWSEVPQRNHKIVVSDKWFAKISNIGKMDDVLFVTNVPDKKASLVKAYAKAICLDRDYKVVVALPELTYFQHWFSAGAGAESGLKTMPFTEYWEAGKALRKARTATTAGRTKYVVQETINGGTDYMTADEILDLDADEILLSYNRGFHPSSGNPVHQEIFAKFNPVIVYLSGTQKKEVLERTIGTTKPTRDFFRQYAQIIVKDLSKRDHRILKAASMKDEANQAGLKFIREHRAAITNAPVVQFVDDFDAVAQMSEKDGQRLKYLQWAFSGAEMDNPYADGAGTKQVDFFKQHLPLLLVTLRNTYTAGQMLGGTANMNQALIDYINAIPVTIV